MARPLTLTVIEARSLPDARCWLVVAEPSLARDMRPGQYVLLRCDEPDDWSRPLPRALFMAATQPLLGQLALVFDIDDAGLAWLARRRPGTTITAYGPLGRAVLPTSGRLALLVDEPRLLAPMLALAHARVSRDAVTLVLVDINLPGFVLPADVEVQQHAGSLAHCFADQAWSDMVLRWADGIVLATRNDIGDQAGAAIQRARPRWSRGFALWLLDRPLVCGSGACGVCRTQTRRGSHLPCVAGIGIDLKELI
jgi:dihydroorotate dehydrogenase electron transfer subunit